MTISVLETHDSVAVLSMSNGTNKQNPAFAKDMLAKLEMVLDNPEHKALIITSSDEKNFSQGIDTDWLMPAMQQGQHDDIREFMSNMDKVFKKLLTFPMPVIAAINGHAFGNGAILACACDFRFMRSDKGFFCFPEVDLSIPFLPGMLAFITMAVPQHRFNEMLLTGRRLGAEELARDHVIEQALSDNESLQSTAMQFALQFDKKRPIFAEHKKRLYKHVIEAIDKENPPIIEALALVV